jgi:hypothetical protein
MSTDDLTQVVSKLENGNEVRFYVTLSEAKSLP